MKLRFIGEDFSIGLQYGQEYKCMIESRGEFIYVLLDHRRKACAYSSIRNLLENWEEV